MKKPLSKLTLLLLAANPPPHPHPQFKSVWTAPFQCVFNKNRLHELYNIKAASYI